MDNIIISNPEKLEEVKRKIAEAGPDRLHVISDFDKTLYPAFINGEKIPSIISQIRNGEYLSKDYAERAHAMYDKYHAIEINPELSRQEKIPFMEEWWRTHYELLIKLSLSKADIERVVKKGKINFRKGVLEFLDTLNNNDIPLIILSATGLGDAISMYFEKEKKMNKNINVVSNFFEFDCDGKARKVREPIIHSMNKHEIVLKQHNIQLFEKIQERKNIILIGDKIEDIGMVEGFEYENIIKIGFLNLKKEIDEQLARYKEVYDVIITGDGDFSYINELIGEIVE